jgi:hypothetical protein
VMGAFKSALKYYPLRHINRSVQNWTVTNVDTNGELPRGEV